MATVLIVDDQRIIAAVLETMVTEAGHAVCGVCTNAADAVGKAVKEAPDVMLLDVRLSNGETGAQVLREAREQGYKGGAVFISAFPETQAAEEIDGVEYDAYLVKPVREDQLASILNSFGEAS